MRLPTQQLSFLLFLLFAFTCLSETVHAEDTRLLIRVKANDAMFIGTLMGGAYVQVKKADSGEILVDGLTAGKVGNFVRVMKAPHARGVRLSDEETAAFVATIDISAPTFVEVLVFGPSEYGQSASLGSTKLWLIPGVHIEGEGLILEISGLLVDVASPHGGRHSLADFTEGALPVRANVAMLCGCPITPAMYWDSNDFTVMAYLKQHGEIISQEKLVWVAESVFGGSLPLIQPGPYEIEIIAYQRETPNAGVGKAHIMVLPNATK